MLDMFLSPTLKLLFDYGFERFKSRKQVKTIRKVLSERLLREIKLNLEIFSDLKDEEEIAIKAIDTSIIEAIFSQPIPLGLLFDNRIPDGDREDACQENQNYRNWMQTILTEADLIERVWHRLAIAKFRQSNNISKGDIKYLKQLLLLMKVCLSRTNAN